MDLQLRDKVVLVTGSAKRIGAAIIRSLAGEGAIRIAFDREATACEQLRGEIKDDSRARFIVVDLSSPDNCRVVVEQSIEASGRLDALVNNVGIKDKIGLETGSPEDFVGSWQRNAPLLQQGPLRASLSEVYLRQYCGHRFNPRKS